MLVQRSVPEPLDFIKGAGFTIHNQDFSTLTHYHSANFQPSMNIDLSRVVSALYSVYCENFTIAGQARQLEQDTEELREDQEALKGLVPLLKKEAQVLRDNPELLAESPQVVLKDDGTVDVKDLQDRDSEIQL